jgi:hypothetical protein
VKILAFGHQKRVGKDTAAGFAMTHLRSTSRCARVTKKGFADKLKQVCYELYSWAGLMPGPWYEEPEHQRLKEVVLPRIGKSPRQIWISFGNEVKAATYMDTWVDYLLHQSSYDFLLISDMRFPNEADRVKAMGGRVVKIIKPDVPHTSDAADDPLLDYDRWDAVITNKHGHLNKFYQDVVDYVEGMFDVAVTK